MAGDLDTIPEPRPASYLGQTSWWWVVTGDGRYESECLTDRRPLVSEAVMAWKWYK